ncbi:MAG TPA: TonB-dependent receptor [Bryobacteraceae bacterium]|nr:TonB-dependent receptor [Bryobacteraceae bacterium]
MLRIVKRLTTLLAFFLTLMPVLVFGQASFEAQVRGVVHDATGSVIIGARVTITDVATNISSATQADERGYYIFNGLHPGTYNLKAEMSGFRAEEMKDVVLAVSQRTNIDLTLNVAGLEQQVTVVEAAPTLDTGNAEIGTTVTGQYTREMPLYGRSYYGLVFLSGGITESAGSGTRDSYPSGTNFISNGQRNSTAEVRFDGAPISAPEQGEGGNSNVYYTPSVEVIQEFKVENNSFSAEYGNNGGTVVNIMMKQGGNQFHGSGWYFGQRDAFDANDFFSNQAGIAKPPHIHDQYGGSVSGPIRKNKTFFLFDYEKQRDIGSSQTVATFPTDLQRSGDFSKTLTFDENGNLAPVTIYNPFAVSADGTRQPFANNVIPPTMIDKVAKNFLSLIPEPNVTGDAGTNYNNYRKNVQSTFSAYQFDARIDHQFNDNNRLGLRYSRLSNNAPTQATFIDDSYVYKTDVHNAVVDYNWTVNPRILYTGRLALDLAIAPGITSYPNLTSVGFPSYMINNGLARMPSMEFDSVYTNLFDQCCVDTHFAHTLYTYSSALSWVKGSHSIKFGGEQRVFFNSFWQPDNPTGIFSFGPDVNNQQAGNGAVTQGDSFASLLLGWGTSGELRIKPPVADKSKETGFYIQDDWKVNSKLTVNIGLRYEWSTPYTERYNRSTFADFTDSSGTTVPGLGEIKGVTLFPVSGRRTLPIDRNNFAPRLGVAYSWDSKTVIRAGAGVYYGANMQTNFQYTGPAYFKNAVSYFTKDNYLTQYATLENPFPNGIPVPQGNKYGKLAMWGFDNGGDLSYELNKNAEIYQWSGGVQRLLPSDFVVAVDYSANRSTHLPWGSFAAGTRNRNFIPSDVRVNYTTHQLNGLVANPFQPLFVGPNAIFNEPDSRYNDPQIPLVNLLRPYPQFDGSFDGLPRQAALSRYDSMQVRFEKRSSKYFTIQGSYTFARATDNSSSGANGWIGWLTNGGPQQLDRLSNEYTVSANNATHRLATAFTGNIPVGRGLLVGSNMNRVVDAVIGGWSASSNVTLQTGQPVHIQMAHARLSGGRQRPNLTCSNPGTGVSYKDAAAALLNGASDGISVFNSACFADPGDQQAGSAPRYFENLNSQGIANVDLGMRKQFHIRETMRFQVRMEAFNAFNRTRFDRAGFRWGGGNFGQVSSLANGFHARQMQIVARFEF